MSGTDGDVTGVVDIAAAPALAWQDEADQEPDTPERVSGSVIAVALLAGLALALAVVAAVVVLTSPKRQPERFSIVPAPVEQAPSPPTAAPPKTITITPKPPVVAAPPSVQPPPARTPPDADDAFVKALNVEGIGITERQGALTDAHIACVNLSRGIPRGVIVEEVLQNTSGYTRSDAAEFVTLSVDYFCPQEQG